MYKAWENIVFLLITRKDQIWQLLDCTRELKCWEVRCRQEEMGRCHSPVAEHGKTYDVSIQELGWNSYCIVEAQVLALMDIWDFGKLQAWQPFTGSCPWTSIGRTWEIQRRGCEAGESLLRWEIPGRGGWWLLQKTQGHSWTLPLDFSRKQKLHISKEVAANCGVNLDTHF